MAKARAIASPYSRVPGTPQTAWFCSEAEVFVSREFSDQVRLYFGLAIQRLYRL